MSIVFIGLIAVFIALLIWPKEPEWKELAGFWLFLCIVGSSLFALFSWIYQLLNKS